MRYLPLAALALPGCAPTTPDSLANLPAQERIESAKPPQKFALCVAGSFAGNTALLNEGDHYWLLREGAGLPYARWDFWPRPGGSYAEVHSRQLGGSGKDKVRACA